MNFYLAKYGFQAPVIEEVPKQSLKLIIVIPCFNEDDLIRSLCSLRDCEETKGAVEVIVVVNAGEYQPQAIKENNLKTFKTAKEWAKANERAWIDFHFIYTDILPKKHAGVGLARKIGMDEAVARFHAINKDGIIACFDADAICEKNYLNVLIDHFSAHPKTPGCAIHYEHPVEGDAYPLEVYEGIVNYELHLRYYNQALKFCGLPYAYHTVGSSMAVRSSAYQKQGGMNKRKAGEDFYFIHKIISLGDFTEIKTTKIIPSPRISDRVPFGTGRAIGDWVAAGKKVYETYSFETFRTIKAFVALIPNLWEDELAAQTSFVEAEEHSVFLQYLSEVEFKEALLEIRKNAKNRAGFIKRFFVWFDAFRILKAVHYLRDNGFENQPLNGQVLVLLDELHEDVPEELNNKAFLHALRRIESA